ncbi:hypothetical protein NDU88_005049 [Pleurodeles waltl]|uniref:Uncharacterized protein n=1 Tax=Pleurodeles waltl TaxID=8319 RepID=A0AAV7UGX1_PLEWA|nr:hypothetical protein NDU88_005049 [Pleurodeles waltl]
MRLFMPANFMNKNISQKEKKDRTSRFATVVIILVRGVCFGSKVRLASKLQMYNYEIMHLQRKDSRVADESLRFPSMNENCEEVDDDECDVAFTYEDVVFIEDLGMELEFSEDK